ncbi:energy-coupling factor ABC transporter ATP-binding protein [Syntrophomonas erecta]
MNCPVFDLKGIKYSFSRGDQVFNNLSLTINPGESIALMGANGSGKTTLLKILGGLYYPQQGEVNAFGYKITEKKMEEANFCQEYYRRVGYLFQNSDVQLFTSRVFDEIAYGPIQLGLPGEMVEQRVNDLLALLGIKHLADRSPYRLSGGEKKKVALASILVQNPQVLILDEPTNGLDPRTARWMVGVLKELNRLGRTLIIATHNFQLVQRLSSRVLLLAEQEGLVFDGLACQALNDRDLLQKLNLI